MSWWAGSPCKREERRSSCLRAAKDPDSPSGKGSAVWQGPSMMEVHCNGNLGPVSSPVFPPSCVAKVNIDSQKKGICTSST